jgi:predicted kinase
MTDESFILMIVLRAMYVARAKTHTMAVVVVVFGLGRQPMQPFAEERNAGESDQQDEAQKSSIK